MPKVQEYGGPKVRQQGGNASLNVSANAAQFGGNIGKAASALGSVVNANALAMQEKDDNAKIKAATVELRRSINQRTHLDEDAYYNRKGINAYDTYEPMKTELLDIRKGIGETLESGRQQEMFQTLSEQYLVSEEESMSRYSAGERVTWLNSQDQAQVTQSQEDGSLRWVDNAVYEENIRLSIDTLAERNGWPPEKVEVEKSAAVSSMHVSALDIVLEKSPEAAETYFESHKENIEPGLHDEIQAKIKTHNDGIWVMAEADRIRVTSGTLGERLDDARATAGNDDKDRRDLLVNQVISEYNQGKAVETEAQATAYEAGKLALINPDNPQSIAQFKTSNPAAWKAMGDGNQADLIIRERNLLDYQEGKDLTAENQADADLTELQKESYDSVTLLMSDGYSLAELQADKAWDDMSDAQETTIVNAVNLKTRLEGDRVEADIKEGQIEAYGFLRAQIANNPNVDLATWATQFPIHWKAIKDSGYEANLVAEQSRASTGVTAKSNPDKVNELRGLLYSGKPGAKTKALNFHSENTMYFSDADSMALNKEVLTFKPPSGSELAMVETDRNQFNRWLKDFDEDADNQMEDVMLGMYQDGINQWRAENDGKKVVPFEVRTQILDNMAMERMKEDGGFMFFDAKVNISDISSKNLGRITSDFKISGIPLTPENILAAYTITNKERQQITAALQSNGDEVTEANIIKLYK